MGKLEYRGAEDDRVAVMCWWSVGVANWYSAIGRGAQYSRAVHSVIEWCKVSRGGAAMVCDKTGGGWMVVLVTHCHSSCAWFVSDTTVVRNRPTVVRLQPRTVFFGSDSCDSCVFVGIFLQIRHIAFASAVSLPVSCVFLGFSVRRVSVVLLLAPPSTALLHHPSLASIRAVLYLFLQVLHFACLIPASAIFACSIGVESLVRRPQSLFATTFSAICVLSSRFSIVCVPPPRFNVVCVPLTRPACCRYDLVPFPGLVFLYYCFFIDGRGVGSSLDISLDVSSTLGDLSATAASFSSNEDLGVVEPWLVRRHVPKSYYGDLSWLDSSVATHKSALCRVGCVRSLWESYFAPYESFFRAIFDDANLSSGLSLANPCADESIFYGPVGSFGFYLFPLEHGFIMPPFIDFEVGVLDYLGCPPSMLSPNYWLHMGGFQAICARLEELAGGVLFCCSSRGRASALVVHRGWVEMLNALEGKSYCYGDLVAHDGGFRFITRRTPPVRTTRGPSSSQPRPPVRPTSARSSTSRRGSGVASDPDFRASWKQSTNPPRPSVALRSRGPLPFDLPDLAGKRKVCPADDTLCDKSAKRGKADQSGSDSRKERRTFSVHPGFAEFVSGFLLPPSLDESRLASLAGAHSCGLVPPYLEVELIPHFATEDSLFNNRYDAAAAVRGKFSCSPDREAMENFIYSYGLRAFRDVITRDLLRALYCQSFYCEFSNSFDEHENARESRNIQTVERAREVMASSREVRADLDAATSRVASLEAELSESRRVAEIARAGEASQRVLVDRLEKRVVELGAELEEEIDKGQDGARWGWDNFHAQLEHLNPRLEYRASSMHIDWEVVDGVFAPIPSDEGGVGPVGVSDDSTDSASDRGGGSTGLAVSPGSDYAPNIVLHGDPSVVIAPSPCGPATVIYPDGVPMSPLSDEVVAAAIIAGDLVRETGCGTPDASPRAIPAIRDLDGPFDGAYLFSAPP
ncbi:uncharacterized protein G2W53_014101 [Senna tora]|uniref:Uncharacterized protein n=1 Tax=Senna tora TaxID=362788 RepID=A0A834WRL2_9FABA|nr:uncharacterized protein G2W53_014101 [Senna tora]